MAVSNEPALERIETLIHRRTESDRRMGYGWMIVPLLPLAAVITIASSFVGILISILPKLSNLSQANTQSTLAPFASGIFALYGIAVILYFGVLFFGALSFYYMVERRNRHFARQQLLFSTIHNYLTSKRPESANAAHLGYIAEDSESQERPRSAGLWSLLYLFVTPIVGLILSYCLTQDIRKHDELQAKFQSTLVPSLSDASLQPPNFAPYKSRGGDPVLFVILSAVTGGLFWIYWYYTLLRDYNGHFADQARFEDQLLQLLKPPQATVTCGTCGGAVPTGAKFCPHCGRQQSA